MMLRTLTSILSCKMFIDVVRNIWSLLKKKRRTLASFQHLPGNKTNPQLYKPVTNLHWLHCGKQEPVGVELSQTFNHSPIPSLLTSLCQCWLDSQQQTFQAFKTMSLTVGRI